jgi:hypothetical protein
VLVTLSHTQTMYTVMPYFKIRNIHFEIRQKVIEYSNVSGLYCQTIIEQYEKITLQYLLQFSLVETKFTFNAQLSKHLIVL